jgi:hypothetical protein
MMARWIRLGSPGPAEFEAACARLARAQADGAAPILAWAQGQEAVQVALRRHLFAVIAPLKYAPGKRARWFSWAAASAAATYRQFGLPAYVEGEALWLHGRKIADGAVSTVDECAVVASSFLAQFPKQCVAAPSRELEQAFRLRLEAQHGWQFDTSWPTESETLHYALA